MNPYAEVKFSTASEYECHGRVVRCQIHGMLKFGFNRFVRFIIYSIERWDRRLVKDQLVLQKYMLNAYHSFPQPFW